MRKIDSSLTDVQATCGESPTRVGAFVVRALGTSAPRAGGGSWVLAAPRGTRIKSLDVWWSWQILQSGSGGAIRVPALGSVFIDPSGVLDPFDGKGRCCSDTAFAIGKAGAFGLPTLTDPAVAFAKLNHQSFPRLRGLDGRGTPLVALSAQCVTACNSTEVVAQYQAYRVKTVVEDPAKPMGMADGLRDGLRVGDAGTAVAVKASDAGSGVREVTLRVDGQVAQRLDGGGGCADVDASNADPLEYNLMAPCPPTRAGSLTLAAANLPDSEPHQLTAVATDAAGQDTVLGSARVALAAPRRFYDPKNGFHNPDLNIAGDRRANGKNVADRARLSLRFVGGRSARKRTVGYSTPARIRGRLRAGGKPVVRARVWLASRLASGEWRISRKPLRTSRRGIVSARLGARSPNRNVRLVYFPYTDTNASAQSASRALRVRSSTTIQTDQGGYRNGDTLTFTGRVIRKRLINSKSVYLQARVRGRWREFATTRADSQGRWRVSHRFEATRRPTIYRFRAVVPSQTGYDWATGYSRTLRVLVTP